MTMSHFGCNRAATPESWLAKGELTARLRCSPRTVEGLHLPAMRVGIKTATAQARWRHTSAVSGIALRRLASPTWPGCFLRMCAKAKRPRNQRGPRATSNRVPEFVCSSCSGTSRPTAVSAVEAFGVRPVALLDEPHRVSRTQTR